MDVASIQPNQVDATRYGCTTGVRPVPLNPVHTGNLSRVHKRSHRLTEQVVNHNAHLGRFGQVVANDRGRVERIRVVLVQRRLLWHRRPGRAVGHTNLHSFDYLHVVHKPAEERWYLGCIRLHPETHSHVRVARAGEGGQRNFLHGPLALDPGERVANHLPGVAAVRAHFHKAVVVSHFQEILGPVTQNSSVRVGKVETEAGLQRNIRVVGVLLARAVVHRILAAVRVQGFESPASLRCHPVAQPVLEILQPDHKRTRIRAGQVVIHRGVASGEKVANGVTVSEFRRNGTDKLIRQITPAQVCRIPNRLREKVHVHRGAVHLQIVRHLGRNRERILAVDGVRQGLVLNDWRHSVRPHVVREHPVRRAGWFGLSKVRILRFHVVLDRGRRTGAGDLAGVQSVPSQSHVHFVKVRLAFLPPVQPDRFEIRNVPAQCDVNVPGCVHVFRVLKVAHVDRAQPLEYASHQFQFDGSGQPGRRAVLGVHCLETEPQVHKPVVTTVANGC